MIKRDDKRSKNPAKRQSVVMAANGVDGLLMSNDQLLTGADLDRLTREQLLELQRMAHDWNAVVADILRGTAVLLEKRHWQNPNVNDRNHNG